MLKKLISIFIKRKRGFEKVSEKQWLIDSRGSTKLEQLDIKEIKLPKRATKNSAGYDIFSPIDFVLYPEDVIIFPLGFKIYMLPDEVFKIYSRSGLGFKFIRLANGTGVIDSDYYNNSGNEGHCAIKLRNEGREKIIIKKDSAIAQGIFQKYLVADNDIPQNENRTGGFGSTDKK